MSTQNQTILLFFIKIPNILWNRFSIGVVYDLDYFHNDYNTVCVVLGIEDVSLVKQREHHHPYILSFLVTPGEASSLVLLVSPWTSPSSPPVTQTFDRVLIGEVPVMFGSTYCYLHHKSSEELTQLGESPTDPGGYIIINGKEFPLLSDLFRKLYKLFTIHLKSYVQKALDARTEWCEGFVVRERPSYQLGIYFYLARRIEHRI